MYQLVVVHDGEDAWAQDVRQALWAAMLRICGSSSDLEDVDPAELDPMLPAAFVYLGTASAASDADIDRMLADAVARAHAVIPLHRGQTDVASVMTPSMKRLNAVDWAANREAAALGILRSLGVAEDIRRLFLSYRRTETSALALQLHTELTRRGFDVFLDRFSVPTGVDFQKRIEVDLADKAFALFLESPHARDSAWVEEEVAYAMSHRIAHLALTPSDLARPLRFPTVDDAFRYHLDRNSDFEPDGQLVATALARVLDEIEVRYAALIRRRRDQILGSLTEQLNNDGYDVTTAGDWAVLAQADGRAPCLFLTTPRAPDAGDLYAVDQLRTPLVSTLVGGLAGVVVHPVADLDATAAELVAWVASHSDLETRYLGA